MATITKIKILSQLLLIALFIIVHESCMEPIIEEESSTSTNSFDIDENIMDPNDENLNLDFEQGLDFWRFNSKKALLNDINHSIQMDISNDQFSSGNQSLKLELVNERFTAARYFSLSSGDSLFTTIDVLLNLDSNHVFIKTNPYRINLRISYFNEDLELLTSSGFTTTSVSNKEWKTLSLNGCLVNPFLEFVRFDLDIYGYDSIPIFVDNLEIAHKPNTEIQNYDFYLEHPNTNTHSEINDTTFFSWQDVIDNDGTSYTHKIYIMLEEDNMLLNSNFETASNQVCTEQNIHPSQWWMFPYCWNFQEGGLDLENGYDPYSAYVSNDIAKIGNSSLRLRGLYSDSLQNFNTVWQWISGDGGNIQSGRSRVLPGSELTFEGYIYTPDSNMISGSNSVELGIWAFNERDESWPSISPVFDKNYSPNQWHKFSVTATIPEWKNTGRTQCGIYLRYNQYNNADGVVYIDDLTVSSNRPYRYTVNTEITNEPVFNWLPSQKNEVLEYWRNWYVRWDNQLSVTRPHAELDTMNFEWEVIVTGQHDEVKSVNGPFYLSVSE